MQTSRPHVLKARPLTDPRVAYHFLMHVVGLSDEDAKAFATLLWRHEREVLERAMHSTLYSPELRQVEYQDHRERQNLWEKICQDFLTQPMAPSPKLGIGGGLPTSPSRSERVAIFVIGPPASGKSSIAVPIADHFGATTLDSDVAKTKLPEYHDGTHAYLVQDESDAILFGSQVLPSDFAPLLSRCAKLGHNILIPKVGKTCASVNLIADRLRKAGYRCYLVLCAIDSMTATKRAFERWQRTGRYVPLSYVLDEVGNEPSLTYYRLKARESKEWSGFAVYSTEQGSPVRKCASDSWPFIMNLDTEIVIKPQEGELDEQDDSSGR